MKSLLARERDRRDGRLWCPLLDTTTCRREGCAHYSPDDTQECIHVEAAMAQVRVAKALERLAECAADPLAMHRGRELAIAPIRQT